MYRILTYSSPEDVLKEPEETEWLIGFLRDDVTAQQRVQILERMLQDHRMQKILAEHNRLDPLLALILEQPDQDRGRLLGRFAASRDLIQKMISEKQTERLIDLAVKEEDTDTRLKYLSGLFRNSTAMTELIKGDGYDRLWELVIGTKDPVEHAKLRGEFYSSSAVIQVVAEKAADAILGRDPLPPDPVATHRAGAA